MSSVREALDDGAACLRGIADNPRLEARLLLGHALGVTQNELIRDPGRRIDAERYRSLLVRRRAREPIALIVGHREFWSLDFEVSPATLVPRADSETLIEAALSAFAGRPPLGVMLDLGTGSGCLLLALLTVFPSAFGIGVDLAAEAAALARRNAVRLGLSDRAAFVVGDWGGALGGRFDLIVCNPPYIADGEISGLMPEVARYEPRCALSGGADGYDAYRTILPNLGQLLTPDGVAIIELGQGQADYVSGLARAVGLSVSLRLDLAQIPRAIIMSLRNS